MCKQKTKHFRCVSGMKSPSVIEVGMHGDRGPDGRARDRIEKHVLESSKRFAVSPTVSRHRRGLKILEVT